jgi:hypothetical protein
LNFNKIYLIIVSECNGNFLLYVSATLNIREYTSAMEYLQIAKRSLKPK